VKETCSNPEHASSFARIARFPYHAAFLALART
jgi:hypothetical protein